ncbi:B3 domain-containing transcription factor VRN1-like isoform X3 [Prosopis cineraria]|uniref:B3 domain-containing transcription factor VRN1-like isoform X3 n=1 Tax=Prosopis cineraria TaxID=364024 RepID=UPI0024100ADB|nr:B3 domain-containing transcription factor VRN1-like isoform X3 [Prosopis cineraria]
MRSKSRLRRRTFVRPSVSLSNAEPSRFFKIILSGTIHTQDMRIPKEFVRRFENELSSEATIGVPDGLALKMELEKSENEAIHSSVW